MSDYFEIEDEVTEIAQELIDKYHPHLAHCKVGFVFRTEAPISKGKITLGQASKVPPKLKPHLDLDYLIWIAHDTWQNLGPTQRIALIDHELCHCGYDVSDAKAGLRPHDIEEFQCIIDRYGLWNSSLQEAASAITKAVQMPFPGSAMANGGSVVKVSPNITVQQLGG